MDYHCHILPGLDDGSRSLEDSVDMARRLVEAGYRRVCCTPHHIRGIFDTTPEQVRSGVARLQQALDAAGIPLTLTPGMEYHLDEFLLDLLDDPLPVDGKLLLIELPTQADPDFVSATLYQIVCRGFTPLIAHPERSELLAFAEPRTRGWFKSLPAKIVNLTRTSNRESHTTPDDANSKFKIQNSAPPLLAYLQNLGCGFQGNLGSFTGRYGSRVRHQAELYRAAGIYTHYGTDAHHLNQF